MATEGFGMGTDIPPARHWSIALCPVLELHSGVARLPFSSLVSSDARNLVLMETSRRQS